MAKKVICHIILTAAISVAAFFMGRNCPGEKYLDMQTVTGYETTETGLLLTTVDGSGYYWEMEEN